MVESVTAHANKRSVSRAQTLPDVRPELVTQQQERETSAAKDGLILIVDDDDMVRRCRVRLIRAKGYTVQAYSSAEEFLTSKPKQRDVPVCLLLDAKLPEMSGLELQRRLAVERRSLPIIFMSAHGAPIVREQALLAGAITFLFKPFDDEALLSAVRSVSRTPGEGMNSDVEAGSFAEQVEVTTQGGHHARKAEQPKNHR